MNSSSYRISRGISESDVWKAADALLLEGARPTIERVRLKIGRGSPNTVSPHLETWFKHLGGRIQDPGAFSAPPEVPDVVMQAARHFWETATATARGEHSDQLAAATQNMAAQVDAYAQQTSSACAAQTIAEQQLQSVKRQLEDAVRALEQSRQAHAADVARLGELRSQLQAAADRHSARESALGSERQQMSESIAQAQQRVAAAEQRAALDMDRERQARARADKRAEAAEHKLQSQRRDFQQQQAREIEHSAQMKATLDHHQHEGEQLRRKHDQLAADRQQLQSLLEETRLALHSTQLDLRTSQDALSQLKTLSPAARSRAARRAARLAKESPGT